VFLPFFKKDITFKKDGTFLKTFWLTIIAFQNGHKMYKKITQRKKKKKKWPKMAKKPFFGFPKKKSDSP